MDIAEVEFEAAVEGLSSVYQPVVDLASVTVVGYEALARGPAGSRLERPERLLAAARERGMTGRVDWACRGAALAGALATDLSKPMTLLVNVEPESVASPCPSELRSVNVEAEERLRIIFEVTERALTVNPASLLRVVEQIRERGSGIALDDVGVDWRSLALMPFIRPDLVKLDISLVQGPLTAKGALVAEAVRAYAAESGAQIVAEGIETEAHLERALGLGATLGQGWMFGRPGVISAEDPGRQRVRPIPIARHEPLDDTSPMDAIVDVATTTVAPRADLVAVSRAIEQRALDTTEPCVILTTFQDAEWFSPPTAALYTRLASRSAFVGAFGFGLAAEPAPGVRGASLDINRHRLGEWAVILVAPHYAIALIAKEIDEPASERERRFDFAVINVRELVLRAARTLMLTMAEQTVDAVAAEAVRR